MNILRFILSCILSVFFPFVWFYKPLSGEERSTENEDRIAHDDGDSVAPLYSPRRSRRLRHAASTSHRDEIAHDRDFWRQFVSFENMRKILSWILSLLLCRDGRRKEITTDSRTLPNPMESESERSNRLFHDKLDLYSETDIIEKCQTLNNKINDVVLSLVDEWSTTRRDHRSHASVMLDPDTQDYLKHSLGLSLFDSIRHATSQRHPEELENRVIDALQALAVFICLQLISRTFSPGVSDSTNHDMQDIFNNMLSRGPQATALRWRALTYTYSCRADAAERFVSAYIKALVHYSCATFVLAGEENIPELLSRVHEVIVESQVVESALTLSQMLKTGLFSVHLDTCCVKPGRPFRKDLMDLDSEKRVAREGVSVLCTIELGICEMTSDNDTSSEVRQGRILLKPKVVLAN